jgi:hypothetical protein
VTDAPTAGDAVPTAPNSWLLSIRRVLIPAEVVAGTHEHLRSMGRVGCEGVAFWAGKHDGNTFLVRAAVTPAQHAGRGEYGGLAVIVDGDELFRMNVWLHRQRMTLIAQLHSHPGEAYHSDTDEAYAVLTRVGGFSIVLPDFAQRPFSLEDAAIYRLAGDGTWRAVSARAARELLQVEG